MRNTLPFPLIALWATTALAAPVELRSSDGYVSFEGEILEYDGKMVTMSTGNGVVNIPANSVNCYGEDCPADLVLAIPAQGDQPGAAADAGAAINLDVMFGDGQDHEALERALEAAAAKADGMSVTIADASAATIEDNATGTKITLSVVDGQSEGKGLRIHQVPYGAQGEVASGGSNWDAPDDGSVFYLESEAFVVATSAQSGVEAVGLDDLARIFAGEITNWADLGGNDVAIQPLQTSPGTEPYLGLRAMVMAPAGREVAADVMNASNEALVGQTLGLMHGGVAFIPADTAGDFTTIDVLDNCGRASSPDGFSVAAGDYPLIMSTYAELDTGIATPAIVRVLDGIAASVTERTIARSEKARALRMDAIVNGALAPQLQQLAGDFVLSIFAADRLAMTLRGGDISGATAARNRLDFNRLASAIAAGEFDGQEVMFLGFTADRGDPGESLNRSQEAAETLLSAFRSFAPQAASNPAVSFLSGGYGSIGLSGCQFAGEGPPPTLVEIWVRPAT